MKALIATMALVMTSTAFSAVTVGKVDVQKVLISVNQGTAVRDQLKKSFDEKQKILKEEEEKIKKLQDDYAKKASVINDKEKAKKEKEIQDKIIAIQQKTAGFQKEIQDMEQKLKGPILDRVKATVDEVSKASDVDFVYEAATAPILYARSEKDLTDEVVKAYNKKFP
ncbi:MAG: OmpH family outer membrane protein, partial [Bdellovibrionales bacterium]|nr:OmpH family outer membrane protein [Bdellovibrionales bacterium]